MNYTDSDIKAIVDTKTEQLQKEISLKDEEYNILKATSDQIEEEQHREIYELNQRITKAVEKLYCWGETLNPEFQKEMLQILNGEV